MQQFLPDSFTKTQAFPPVQGGRYVYLKIVKQDVDSTANTDSEKMSYCILCNSSTFYLFIF